MPHELWPNRSFTADQRPSRSRVSSLCRPLRRGPPTAGVLLLGSVFDDGLRSVDLPRKPSRYRGVPSLTAGETLPPGLPRSRVSLDAGRCQRESRLAHLRRFRPSAHRHCATVVCSRSHGRRSRAKSDRKSTRLNSSHSQISYAVFCLKKKKISAPFPPPEHTLHTLCC